MSSRLSVCGVAEIYWSASVGPAGALVGGVTADMSGLRPATLVVAALTAVSGALVTTRMPETHPAPTRQRPVRHLHPTPSIRGD